MLNCSVNGDAAKKVNNNVHHSKTGGGEIVRECAIAHECGDRRRDIALGKRPSMPGPSHEVSGGPGTRTLALGGALAVNDAPFYVMVLAQGITYRD